MLVPLPASAQTPDVIAEINETLSTLFVIDTHFSLPIERPMEYALSFEVADELMAACPGLFPQDFQAIRDVMFPAYVHYVFEHKKLERLPEGTGFLEGALYLIAQSGSGAYPSYFRREALRELGPAVLAGELVDVLGGCGSDAMRVLADALYATGTFGMPKLHDFPSTYIRQEVTENGIGFLCYYDDDPSDATVQYQGYKRISLLNIADQSMLGAYVRALMRVAYEDPLLATDPPIPFMRSDCPPTPDPRFPVQSEFSAPQAPAGTDALSVPERFAAYFIEAYVPQARKRYDPATLPPVPDALLAELREEIIKFETSPLSVLDQNGREAAYKANHGERLWELSEDGNKVGVDRYLAVRYFVLEELGF